MASMKLRVRAATGGPTFKVQVPLLCTLQGLKDVLGPLISLSASSFSLSFNKKDEIQGPGTTLLSSVGVTSGDLLFYIVNPGGSFPVLLSGSPSSRVARSAMPTEPRDARASVPSIDGLGAIPTRGGRASSTPSTRRELCAAAAARRAAANLATEQQREISMVGSDLTTLNEQTTAGISDTMASAGVVISPSSSFRATQEAGSGMDLEANEAGPIEVPPRVWGHRLVPIPDLLQRVLNTEFENIRQPSMFLVLAVHSVMLETGFLRIETRGHNLRNTVVAESRTVEGYELPSGWSGTGLVNLSYTLPELSGFVAGRGSGQEALLRCQIVGNSVVVYGAVTGGSVHRVSLSVSKFLHENLKLPTLDAAGATSTRGGESVLQGGEAVVNGRVLSGDGAQVVASASMGEDIFSGIFELWKEVKDWLSLPLLTCMCEATGLPPPPSLLRLPTELKIKVLDLLPSLALANLACSCSEFRFLTSSEELWKQKYKEEFGACGERAPGGRGWKSAFVREFEHRRRREEERREAERRFLAEVFTPGVIMRPPAFPSPFGDFFHGLGGEPPQYNLSRGLRIRRTPSVNYGGAFPFTPSSSTESLDGFCFPPMEYEGHGERPWPPVNVPGTRGTRHRYGRFGGDDAGNGALPPFQVHPIHPFRALGPNS